MRAAWTTISARAICARPGTAARISSAAAWTGRASRTGSRRIPDAARVKLPDLALDDSGVFDAMARRRSLRAYSSEPLALGELSALLWAAAGVTARQDGFAFRTAPSAGGLYPIEHYVIANDVEGLEQGLYHYDVLGRALERLYAGDLRLPIARAALDQRIAADAQAVFVWTAVLERSRWKYGERFLRYVLLDAGHIAENVALAATALGLGTCQIAAFFDEEAAGILGVDPDVEPVVYMSTAGRPGDDALHPAARRAPLTAAGQSEPSSSRAAGSRSASQAATSANTWSRSDLVEELVVEVLVGHELLVGRPDGGEERLGERRVGDLVVRAVQQQQRQGDARRAGHGRVLGGQGLGRPARRGDVVDERVGDVGLHDRLVVREVGGHHRVADVAAGPERGEHLGAEELRAARAAP